MASEELEQDIELVRLLVDHHGDLPQAQAFERLVFAARRVNASSTPAPLRAPLSESRAGRGARALWPAEDEPQSPAAPDVANPTRCGCGVWRSEDDPDLRLPNFGVAGLTQRHVHGYPASPRAKACRRCGAFYVCELAGMAPEPYR